jgi:hypothetical protein
MKRIALVIFAGMVVIASCNKNEQAKVTQKELREYVDSIKKTEPDYTDGYWVRVEEGYQARVTKAENAAGNDAEEKKNVEKQKEEYQEFKAKYQADYQKKKDDEVAARKQAFRDALFGQGKIGADMSFSWVDGSNIRGVYENFVRVVDANKDTYTREDWDEVKVLYEALDTRKNEIEKSISSKDNMAIAKQKIGFASIKALNRPVEKAKENSEAKEQNM